MKSETRRKLVLIQGGAAEGVGPVTRMKLWERFEPVTRRQWAFIIAGKSAVVVSLLYFFFAK